MPAPHLSNLDFKVHRSAAAIHQRAVIISVNSKIVDSRLLVLLTMVFRLQEVEVGIFRTYNGLLVLELVDVARLIRATPLYINRDSLKVLHRHNHRLHRNHNRNHNRNHHRP